MIKRPSLEWDTQVSASARQMKMRVVLQRETEGTLAEYRYDDRLISVNIDKTATKGKIYGFIMGQKLVVEIRDIETPPTVDGANTNPQIGDYLNVIYWVNELDPIETATAYYIQDIKRDTVKKTMTITAFDELTYKIQGHTYSELTLTFPTRPMDIVRAIGSILNISVMFRVDAAIRVLFQQSYPEDAPPNFSPSTPLYDVLEDIAEYTGSLIYLDDMNKIMLANISFAEGKPSWNYTIDTNQYFDLTTEKPITFTGVKICNSLGDNVLLGTDTGYCPTIMDNGFCNSKEKIDIIDTLLVPRFTELFSNLTPYSLKWRGNPAMMPYDKITVNQVDGTSFSTLYCGESITYNGGYSVKAGWTGEKASDIRTNPNITQVIKQTSAFVDKVNNKVNIIAAENKDQDKKLSELEITANSINSRVSETQTQIDETNEAVKELSNAVSQTITPHDLTVEVQKQIKEGVSEVNTTTGFKFNDEGLTVSKSGNDISTQITENGMTVSKNSNVLLTANNEGVDAKNLHATTYLIVGKNSRFEDMGSNQSACFWIGG